MNYSIKFLFNMCCFCDTISAMKSKISFLTILVMMLGMNCAGASECIDDDCELSSTVVTEEISESVDFLEPQKTSGSIWSVENITTNDSQYDCEYDYNCPFTTADECEIWYKKPIHKEYVAPREPRINPIKIEDMIYAVEQSTQISANNAVFAPLVERYKMLISASKACCTEGIIYKMHNKKASDNQIYRFLKDDANYFAVGTRCLVMNNNDISSNYSNGVNGEMVTDVRNTCLCKNREWFNSLLAPFKDLYKSVPSFESSDFNYTYSDGMRRNITVSVNQDVQNTINMLSECPD